MQFRKWFKALILESKQNIINLRYPEIIAIILYEKFDKYAPLIAKWFREAKFSREIPDNWWFQLTADHRRTPSLYDLTVLYSATDNIENYKQAMEKLELSPQDYDESSLPEERKALRSQITALFFQDWFFSQPIIQDIQNGKLKDVAPYKHLTFWDAQHKYDEKRVFQETTPLKTYKNGFKWINVGKKCSMVGHLMKNCGSAGLMSWDEDRTIITLFGPENTPHVVVTYSPNEKRISGDEGVAGSEVKTKYHSYVIDLAQLLGATFDTGKTKSSFLKMKYLLKDKAKGIRPIKTRMHSGELFTFNVQGKIYYSDGYLVIVKEDVQKVQNAIQQGTLILPNKQSSILKTIFNHMNQPTLKQFGIQYTSVNQF